MGKVFVGCLIAAALLGRPLISAADDTYPTNLELIEHGVRMAIDSMEVDPPRDLSAHLEIDATSGSEASWLLDSVLKEKLLSMGWRIRAQSESSDTNSGTEAVFLLKMPVIDLGLKYGRSWRRYLLGTKVVERVARVSIYYELIDKANGQVVVSSSTRSEVRDVVPASLLSTLSDSKYPFASPELEKSQLDRYLEGGLVIAIIGVLVYLFYSNKTAS